ncbi:MAG: hypothetical protein ACYC4D_00015 [Thermoleophilia bacterium]
MKKKIPLDSKLPVKLTVRECNIIRDETFCDPRLVRLASVDGKHVLIEWSLDEIEDVQGFVAAEANHTENKQLETALDRIFIKLQVYLDSYDDQEE